MVRVLITNVPAEGYILIRGSMLPVHPLAARTSVSHCFWKILPNVMIGAEGLVVASFFLPPPPAQDHAFVHVQLAHLVEGERNWCRSRYAVVLVLNSDIDILLMLWYFDVDTSVGIVCGCWYFDTDIGVLISTSVFWCRHWFVVLVSEVDVLYLISILIFDVDIFVFWYRYCCFDIDIAWFVMLVLNTDVDIITFTSVLIFEIDILVFRHRCW